MSLRMELSNMIENTTKRKDDMNELHRSMEHLKKIENILDSYKNSMQEYNNKSNSYDMKCYEKMTHFQSMIEKNANDIKALSELAMDTKGILSNLDKTIELSGNKVELSSIKAEEKTEEIGEKIINNVNELISEQLKQINFQMNAQLSSITSEFGIIKKVIKKQTLLSFLLFFILGAGLSMLTILVLYSMDYIPF